MQIENYLTHIESNVSLSRKLGVAPSLVSQWRCGTRPIPFERCPQIEKATAGMVSRKDLCPDNWRELWPELDYDPARELCEEELIYLISIRDETISDLIAKIKVLEKELAAI